MLHRLEGVPAHVGLTALIAPSGYGKTVLLRQWTASSQADVAWTSLDDADNDPFQLLQDIAVAAGFPDPVEESGASLLAPRGPRAEHAAVRRLASALASRGRPVVLVLDDAHLLRRSGASQVLQLLVENLPATCRLVLAAQRLPRLHLGRLRGQGRYAEFGADDLALSRAEAVEVLERCGVRLRDRSLRALLSRTEGWPAGVYLSGQSLRHAIDADEAAAATDGVSRYIVDYLRDEVLATQSAEMVRFLMRTAVLDELSGALCDAVLGVTGSAAWLSEIQERNLFVVPAGEGGRRLRYHRLFRQVLLAELRRREPGEQERLHARAAEWFEARCDVPQAVEHAGRSGHPSAATRMIVRNSFALTARSCPARKAHWLSLDDSALTGDAATAVAAGRIWAAAGDAARAQRALSAATAAQPHGPMQDGPMQDGSASLESAVLQLRAALTPNGIWRMRADAARAVAMEPPGNRWHPTASVLLGVALGLTGAPDAAAQTLERAARLAGDDQPVVRVDALGQLAALEIRRGHWPAAAELAVEALQVLVVARADDGPAALLPRAVAARVRLQAADVHGARLHAQQASRLYGERPPVAAPWAAAQVAHLLAEVLIGLGDLKTAGRRLRDAARYLSLLGDAEVLADDHRRLVEELERAGERSQVLEATHLTPAEHRILRLLPTHLSVGDIAGQLTISRNTAKTQVSSVYRKLGVMSRSDAVRTAQDRGLLDR